MVKNNTEEYNFEENKNALEEVKYHMDVQYFVATMQQAACSRSPVDDRQVLAYRNYLSREYGLSSDDDFHRACASTHYVRSSGLEDKVNDGGDVV